jgi:release factor glutamine methyltransferase
MATTDTEKQWTILSLIRWSEEYLAEKGIDSPRLNAELLLASVLGYKRIDLYTRFDKPLLREELDRYKALFVRRIKKEPLQYILGYADFYGRRFWVRPGVLIPRPETEHIIEATIELLKEKDIQSPRILDIGTGSGCIAVTLAAEIEGASITAVDVSDSALICAGENAAQHAMEDKIAFKKVNILDPYSAIPDSGLYDFIVTNPPYIPLREWEKLPDEIKVHEPKYALTDEKDGLTFLRRLAELAPATLKPGGWLICEIGFGQFDEVRELFDRSGVREIKHWHDLAGIKRIIGGHW